jgi:hypothetical protein
MNAFDDLMILLRLATDPEAVKARLTELQAAIAAADTRKAEADTAHAKLETERSRLTKLEASLREREVDLFSSERRHENALDELRKWQREHGPSNRLIHYPGGVTQEPDLSKQGRDPIDDPFAEPMGLTPRPIAASSHKAARVSAPRRARA